ncbi:MAG: anti-sigma factor family protein [Bacillota bacterium]
MQCHEIQESLSAYLDGMLDPSVTDSVDRHLKRCPVCRSEAEDLKMIVRLVRELPEVEPPAGFRTELRAKLDRVPAPAGKAGLIQKISRGRWAGIVALAASFLLVVGTAASVWDGFPLKSGVQEISVKKGDYEAVTASPGDRNGAKTAGGGTERLPVVAGTNTAQESMAGYHSEKMDLKTDFNSITSPERIKKQEDKIKLEAVRDEAVTLQSLNAAPDGNGVAGRGAAAAPASTQPPLHKNAILGLQVGDKTSATREFFSIARRYGGVAAVLPDTGEREILLRVPEESFEKVISDVGRTGKITREDYSGQAGTAALPPRMEKIEAFGRGGPEPEKAAANGAVSQDVYAAGAAAKDQDISRMDSGAVMATIRIRLE